MPGVSGDLFDDPDRTVHAKTNDGAELVRYDRGGKWFIEWPREQMKPCRHIGVGEAARLARDGFVFFNRPGGRVFERKVRALRAQEAVEARRV